MHRDMWRGTSIALHDRENTRTKIDTKGMENTVVSTEDVREVVALCDTGAYNPVK